MTEPSTRDKMNELRRMCDRVCSLIVDSDYPEVDVLIERARARQRCEELFPDRVALFDLIYESRFDRLWRQFRKPEEANGDV